MDTRTDSFYYLPPELTGIIAEYDPVYRIKPGIDTTRFHFHNDLVADCDVMMPFVLAATHNEFGISAYECDAAVSYLVDHPSSIDWETWAGSSNETIIEYLIAHISSVDMDVFLSNPDDIAVDYILQNIDKASGVGGGLRGVEPPAALSRNENDRIVKYLIDHPDKIVWDDFSRTESEIAVKYCEQHQDKIVWDSMWCNKMAAHLTVQNMHRVTAERIEYMSDMEQDCIVSWFIEHPNQITWEGFSANTNDKAVECCIAHPDLIDWISFSTNTNSRAVQFCIETSDPDWDGYHAMDERMPGHARLQGRHNANFSDNVNDLAVEFLLSNEDQIEWRGLSYNENPKAVSYCIDHQDELWWDRFTCNKGIVEPDPAASFLSGLASLDRNDTQ
jgi:hypothetical protein